MRPVEIGLVDTTGKNIDIDTMAAAVAALNVQITQHLPRYWSTVAPAVVRLLTKPEPIPPSVWPIMLVDDLKHQVHGFHYTSHNQPAAKVVATPDDNDWTIAASHEALEMLVDPSGNRLQIAQGIRLSDGEIHDDEGDCQYLLEICDPCESHDCHYKIGDIKVSDFITPDFYDPLQGERYSFAGNIKAPRRILPGGYITWVHPKTAHTSEILQLIWLDPKGKPKIRCLGTAVDRGKSTVGNFRAFVDSGTHHLIRAAKDFPFRFRIHADHETEPTKYEHEHWVTFRHEGKIRVNSLHPDAKPEELTVGPRGKPIKRPAGTHHTVRNIGEALLEGDKDLIDPATVRS